MFKIEIKKGESIDKALKRYKRKFDQTKVVKQIRERMQYEKPSVKKRRIKLRAIYRQKIQSQQEIYK